MLSISFPEKPLPKDTPPCSQAGSWSSHTKPFSAYDILWGFSSGTQLILPRTQLEILYPKAPA